jgi:hypothetical protein
MENWKAYRTIAAGCCIALCVFAQTYGQQEDYAQWGYSKGITINTSATGYNVSGTVYNFPLLVRLSNMDSLVFSQAQRNGADIRFAQSNGKHLNYQITRWDSAQRKAAIWVKVDTVFGNNALQALTVCWGKAGAADSSSGRRVFDTTQGFVAVYHLNDASGNAVDATANNLSATANGAISYNQGGIIAASDSLSGSGAYFNGGNSTKFQMNTNNRVTISAWAKWHHSP